VISKQSVDSASIGELVWQKMSVKELGMGFTALHDLYVAVDNPSLFVALRKQRTTHAEAAFGYSWVLQHTACVHQETLGTAWASADRSLADMDPQTAMRMTPIYHDWSHSRHLRTSSIFQ
jgi:hypothetical protein